MARITQLRAPLRRRLEATDGTRKQRPMFVEIDRHGAVTVWPRRCKPESMHVRDIYINGNRLRRGRELVAKRKAKGVSK